MKKTLRIVMAIVLTALAVVCIAVPALAEEGGDSPGAMDVEPGGNEDPGAQEPDPSPPDDPTPPEEPTPPVSDPTDEPTAGPTDEPTVEPTDEPTGEPTDAPTDAPTDEPTGEPTDEPTAEPTDEPTPEPTEEPTYVEPSGNAGGTTGGDAPTGPRTPRGSGTAIVQPSFAPRGSAAPIATPTPKPDPETLEPRYITFAKVTQKSNSMSRVLFYSGAGCIGAGVLGLLVLTVFIIRNRRIDDRNEIFEEIAHAEIRQPVQVRGRRQPETGYEGYEEYESYPQPPAAPEPVPSQELGVGSHGQAPRGYEAQPVLHRPEPESLAMPVNGSLYTEEFEIPQEAYQPPARAVRPESAALYTGEFAPPQPAASARAVRPQPTSMYTEEFVLPEDMAQSPVPQPPQPTRQPAARPQPQPKQDPQFDTSELLREILHGDGE